MTEHAAHQKAQGATDLADGCAAAVDSSEAHLLVVLGEPIVEQGFDGPRQYRAAHPPADEARHVAEEIRHGEPDGKRHRFEQTGDENQVLAWQAITQDSQQNL